MINLNKMSFLLIKTLLYFIGFLVSSNIYATDAITTYSEQLQHSKIQVIASHSSVQSGDKIWLDVILNPEPHWHVYWQNPGDSGAPLRIKWRSPEGITAKKPKYFPPELIPIEPLVNYGYSGEAHHLIEITLPDELTNPVIVAAEANWLTCQEVCVPESTTFQLSLNLAPTKASNEQSTIRQKLAEIESNPIIYTVFEIDDQVQLKFELPIDYNGNYLNAYVFLAEEGIVEPSAPQNCELIDNGLSCTLEKSPLASTYTSVSGYLQLNTKNKTQYYRFKSEPKSLTTTNNSTTTALWLVLLFALLGGAILNLMPCVFPVLSLKLLHLVNLSEYEPRQARGFVLSYTLGVLASFALLAAFILIAKSLGESIGWGFQLQQPEFILFLIVILYLVSLNLFGLFEVPGFSISGNIHQGKLEPFFTGVLAVLLATPCTAPFMATAIGVSLTQTNLIAFSIFMALGVGFALPFLIIGGVPAIVHRLPKPGQWMVTLKQLLAFPILLTLIWLLWVLGKQTSTNYISIILADLVLLSFLVWMYTRTKNLVLRACAWLLLILGLTASFPVPEHQKYETPSRIDFSEFDQQATFVNVTADWCVTCKVNERLVLSRKETQQFFTENGIRQIKLDWTLEDPIITAYLNSFERSGVPLYVLYKPGWPPQILPQILSVDTIQSHWKQKR